MQKVGSCSAPARTLTWMLSEAAAMGQLSAINHLTLRKAAECSMDSRNVQDKRKECSFLSLLA